MRNGHSPHTGIRTWLEHYNVDKFGLHYMNSTSKSKVHMLYYYQALVFHAVRQRNQAARHLECQTSRHEG